MNDNTILVKRLDHAQGLPLPRRMTRGSSGCDVCAAVDSELIIPSGGRALVPTGLCLEIPEGYEVQVRPRSGLAFRFGVTVLNAPGTIDADYRGEVKIILSNFGDQPFSVKRGDRIAQLVPASVATSLDFAEIESITETTRGAGGFGHTGI
ncbi:MAG TPA: dUTP diphosphatase [Chitinispirillaceae bacterium]|nr:dUTP diphosphatase [Chitinispirillaceae bacterium]